ncbi:hypothetical protein WH50_25160 [Pokkaliibacter plantistimulans]|uniref:Phospholipase/carboxylesterase/thioesterase domain-containing protein n=1 Tax=Pokkaliibacter plantistimulans TaxID=1635171 RepID=A0ABX5LT09_9GAMM|nr:carboxylesterase [Pokkaliibacter plantistimulans]PXF28658.1 hypothetical protein WH50_25160 [Pokkaliibacter plantistimulans]
MLNYEVVEPRGEHRASVIWLHGLGADGHDFVPVIPLLGLSEHVRFILPHAPVQPVTINGGYLMPSWYDILETLPERKVDEQGLDAAAGWIGALIEAEHQGGIAYDRIALVGFSQGGAVAYHTGLGYAQALAGIVALSTYIASPGRLQLAQAALPRSLPVAIMHGEADDVVPFMLGQQALSTLQGWGLTPQWRAFRHMGHEVTVEEIQQIATFLREILI